MRRLQRENVNSLCRTRSDSNKTRKNKHAAVGSYFDFDIRSYCIKSCLGNIRKQFDVVEKNVEAEEFDMPEWQIKTIVYKAQNKLFAHT